MRRLASCPKVCLSHAKNGIHGKPYASKHQGEVVISFLNPKPLKFKPLNPLNPAGFEVWLLLRPLVFNLGDNELPFPFPQLYPETPKAKKPSSTQNLEGGLSLRDFVPVLCKLQSFGFRVLGFRSLGFRVYAN